VGKRNGKGKLRASLTPESRCWICEMPFSKAWPATADHLVPVSMGGGGSVANLAPAHEICNVMRGSRPECARGEVLIDLALWGERILRRSGKAARRWRPFVLQLDASLVPRELPGDQLQIGLQLGEVEPAGGDLRACCPVGAENPVGFLDVDLEERPGHLQELAPGHDSDAV
jgi:hypothetical protein